MAATPSDDLKARIRQMSPQERALLQQRLAARGGRAASDRTIPRRKGSGPCALSFCQQRLWFLDQLVPHASTYNVPYALEINGELRAEALAQALEMVVERHHVLRTVFLCPEGNAVQVVLPKWPAVLRQIDLRDMPQAQRDAEARRLLKAEAARPFRLDRNVKLRGTLVRLADQKYVLLHVSHHIAWDYRSRVVLYEELSHLYTALCNGTAAALPELPIQYADFAVWQRQALQGEELARLAEYWKTRLAGAPPHLELPTDFPRPAVQTQEGAKYFFTLGAGLADAARALGRQEGATLYMTLLAAFKAFLRYRTAQDSISVGSPIAGRNQPQTEPLIGFFINTLVLNTDLSGNPTFRQLLGRAREVTLGAYAHQEMPFEKLVEVVRPTRDLSRNPLFQVNFRVAGAAAPLLSLPGVSVTLLDLIDTVSSKFDLAVEVSTVEGSQGYWEYSTRLFSQATIARMCDEFQQVLGAVLRQPDTPLADLEVRQALGTRPETPATRVKGPIRRRATAPQTAPDNGRGRQAATQAPSASAGTSDDFPSLALRACVRQTLLGHPAVADCAVLSRPTEQGGPELVAYVVPAGPFVPQHLEVHLYRNLPAGPHPAAYVGVAALPLTADGQLDEDALTRLEVIDAELVRRWEESLRALPEVEEAAVVVQEQAEMPVPLHLSDVLPNWKAGAAAAETAAHLPTADAAEAQASAAVPALSEGPPLRREAGAPTTLPEALRRAVLRSPDKGVLYVQADGSELFQPYPALQEDVERILAGLRKLGLKPQDKVLFQLDLNQDFIPAFWACVLGGFVPVPISIPPTYEQVNANVSKLHNAWLMMDRPIVLTRREMAPAVESLCGLLPLEGLRVIAVEDLRANPPDGNWHAADPEDLLLMLLTSGSTGKPKAVMQCHRSVLARSAATAQMNHFSDKDVSLNWFPLDHVGGIVMFHVRDMYLSCRQVHAPTQYILRDPLQWLDLVERHRVSITWAPNFAYGLINARAEEVARRRWDLSSLGFILNAGEAIVAKTARRFLEILAPHGLPPTAMRPAWGMSETSSAVTFSDLFTLESTSDKDQFVEVGAPVPGFAVRIVDGNNQLIEEGKTGALQVRGLSVTSGYYQNPELNREVFTPDGWFNTGDLGCLRQGRLTITGRQKDVIIINGVNFFSHELEAVVEEVPGVEVSYTAACAVREAGQNTDSLAIFFHSPLAAGDRLVGLLKEIRGRVVRNAGVNPNFLIPVAKEDVPKTEIGKIQRAQLRQRFEAGAFAGVLKQIDVASGNANTLPDWFYRTTWRRKESFGEPPVVQPGPALIFLDGLGLGAALAAELAGQPCVSVEPGEEFVRLDNDRYRLRPGQAEDYHRLAECLERDGVIPARVFHLWTYDRPAGEIASVEALERAQHVGLFSVLSLAQALSRLRRPEGRIRLLIVSSHAQPAGPADELAPEKAPLVALVNSLAQELPQFACTHIDLPLGSATANAALVLWELPDRGDREVAYRDGRRLVPRLERIDLRGQEKQAVPFKPGGVYLLSGGIGGIGLEVARYLLNEYQARLLLIGRTPLPQAELRLRTLQELGEIRYAAVDVADLEGLRLAAKEAESQWGRSLDGVLHLAGTYEEHALAEAPRDGIAAVLRPKLAGTWALHQLLADRPGVFFLGFSSVLSFFGGAMVGAYAAANRFLEYFCRDQNARQPGRSSCYAWCTWAGIGMSRGYENKGPLRAKGIADVSAPQALHSLMAGLHHSQPHLLIGLDPGNASIRRHLEPPPLPLQQLRAYYAVRGGRLTLLRPVEVRDRFGLLSRCEVRQIASLPRTAGGEIDREQLRGAAGRGTAEHVAPRTDRERRIAEIWQEVLGLPQVGVVDNFFELGGHSLLASKVLARLHDAFGVELSLRQLFEASTVAGLARTLDTASVVDDLAAPPPLSPVPREGHLPLSFAQQRLWFLYQLDPASPVYNIPTVVRLRGPLNVAALERSFTALVRRHEALRTTLPAVEGRPVQVIGPARPVELPIADLRELPRQARQSRALRLVTEEARRPFDITRDLLLRPCLLQLDAEDYILSQTIHHIASDGWSNGILFRELAALYEAFCTGEDPDLPPLPIQYADYAVWQRQWLEGGGLQKQLAYWKQQLAGAPAHLDLPADHPRPATQSFRGAVLRVALPRALADAARDICRAEETTLFMTLLAAFQTLLYGYTGQEDVCVGSPIAGRSRTETEGLIGFFANTLVLRTRLAGNPTFRQVLRRAREMALEAFAHQDVPFEKLVEALRPVRDASRNPLFQVNFRVQTAPPPHLELLGMTAEPLDVDPGIARFDLALDLWVRDDSLQGYFEYNTDLFEPASVLRISRDWERLLGVLLGRPDTPLNDLETVQELRRPAAPTGRGLPRVPGYRGIGRRAVDLT
jgi:non-ribosomal peptide synthetase component F/NAD(P)-dependent dehydrogenase (short-subunit alcohol dehydrogenase family)